MGCFLPSEIAKLVLGYLKEEQCIRSYRAFLTESSNLKEYAQLLSLGREYATSVWGKSLLQLLEEYGQAKIEEEKMLKNGMVKLWVKFNAQTMGPQAFPLTPNTAKNAGPYLPTKPSGDMRVFVPGPAPVVVTKPQPAPKLLASKQRYKNRKRLAQLDQLRNSDQETGSESESVPSTSGRDNRLQPCSSAPDVEVSSPCASPDRLPTPLPVKSSGRRNKAPSKSQPNSSAAHHLGERTLVESHSSCTSVGTSQQKHVSISPNNPKTKQSRRGRKHIDNMPSPNQKSGPCRRLDMTPQPESPRRSPRMCLLRSPKAAAGDMMDCSAMDTGFDSDHIPSSHSTPVKSVRSETLRDQSFRSMACPSPSFSGVIGTPCKAQATTPPRSSCSAPGASHADPASCEAGSASICTASEAQPDPRPPATPHKQDAPQGLSALMVTPAKSVADSDRGSIYGKSPRRKPPAPKRRSMGETILSGRSGSAENTNSELKNIRDDTISPQVLEELLSNKAWAEKLAENINKVNEVKGIVKQDEVKATATEPEVKVTSDSAETVCEKNGVCPDVSSKTLQPSPVENPDDLHTRIGEQVDRDIPSDAMHDIIDMMFHEPEFDALFNMFKVDKYAYVEKEYGVPVSSASHMSLSDATESAYQHLYKDSGGSGAAPARTEAPSDTINAQIPNATSCLVNTTHTPPVSTCASISHTVTSSVALASQPVSSPSKSATNLMSNSTRKASGEISVVSKEVAPSNNGAADCGPVLQLVDLPVPHSTSPEGSINRLRVVHKGMPTSSNKTPETVQILHPSTVLSDGTVKPGLVETVQIVAASPAQVAPESGTPSGHSHQEQMEADVHVQPVVTDSGDAPPALLLSPRTIMRMAPAKERHTSEDSLDAESVTSSDASSGVFEMGKRGRPFGCKDSKYIRRQRTKREATGQNPVTIRELDESGPPKALHPHYRENVQAPTVKKQNARVTRSAASLAKPDTAAASGSQPVTIRVAGATAADISRLITQIVVPGPGNKGLQFKLPENLQLHSGIKEQHFKLPQVTQTDLSLAGNTEASVSNLVKSSSASVPSAVPGQPAPSMPTLTASPEKPVADEPPKKRGRSTKSAKSGSGTRKTNKSPPQSKPGKSASKARKSSALQSGTGDLPPGDEITQSEPLPVTSPSPSKPNSRVRTPKIVSKKCPPKSSRRGRVATRGGKGSRGRGGVKILSARSTPPLKDVDFDMANMEELVETSRPLPKPVLAEGEEIIEVPVDIECDTSVEMTPKKRRPSSPHDNNSMLDMPTFCEPTPKKNSESIGQSSSLVRVDVTQLLSPSGQNGRNQAGNQVDSPLHLSRTCRKSEGNSKGITPGKVPAGNLDSPRDSQKSGALQDPTILYSASQSSQLTSQDLHGGSTQQSQVVNTQESTILCLASQEFQHEPEAHWVGNDIPRKATAETLISQEAKNQLSPLSTPQGPASSQTPVSHSQNSDILFPSSQELDPRCGKSEVMTPQDISNDDLVDAPVSGSHGTAWTPCQLSSPQSVPPPPVTTTAFSPCSASMPAVLAAPAQRQRDIEEYGVSTIKKTPRISRVPRRQDVVTPAVSLRAPSMHSTPILPEAGLGTQRRSHGAAQSLPTHSPSAPVSRVATPIVFSNAPSPAMSDGQSQSQLRRPRRIRPIEVPHDSSDTSWPPEKAIVRSEGPDTLPTYYASDSQGSGMSTSVSPTCLTTSTKGSDRPIPAVAVKSPRKPTPKKKKAKKAKKEKSRNSVTNKSSKKGKDSVKEGKSDSQTAEFLNINFDGNIQKVPLSSVAKAVASLAHTDSGKVFLDALKSTSTSSSPQKGSGKKGSAGKKRSSRRSRTNSSNKVASSSSSTHDLNDSAILSGYEHLSMPDVMSIAVSVDDAENIRLLTETGVVPSMAEQSLLSPAKQPKKKEKKNKRKGGMKKKKMADLSIAPLKKNTAAQVSTENISTQENTSSSVLVQSANIGTVTVDSERSRPCSEKYVESNRIDTNSSNSKSSSRTSSPARNHVRTLQFGSPPTDSSAGSAGFVPALGSNPGSANASPQGYNVIKTSRSNDGSKQTDKKDSSMPEHNKTLCLSTTANASLFNVDSLLGLPSADKPALGMDTSNPIRTLDLHSTSSNLLFSDSMSRFSVSNLMTDSMQCELIQTLDTLANSPKKNLNLDTPVFKIPQGLTPRKAVATQSKFKRNLSDLSESDSLDASPYKQLFEVQEELANKGPAASFNALMSPARLGSHAPSQSAKDLTAMADVNSNLLTLANAVEQMTQADLTLPSINPKPLKTVDKLKKGKKQRDKVNAQVKSADESSNNDSDSIRKKPLRQHSDLGNPESKVKKSKSKKTGGKADLLSKSSKENSGPSKISKEGSGSSKLPKEKSGISKGGKSERKSRSTKSAKSVMNKGAQNAPRLAASSDMKGSINEYDLPLDLSTGSDTNNICDDRTEFTGIKRQTEPEEFSFSGGSAPRVARDKSFHPDARDIGDILRSESQAHNNVMTSTLDYSKKGSGPKNAYLFSPERLLGSHVRKPSSTEAASSVLSQSVDSGSSSPDVFSPSEEFPVSSKAAQNDGSQTHDQVIQPTENRSEVSPARSWDNPASQNVRDVSPARGRFGSSPAHLDETSQASPLLKRAMMKTAQSPSAFGQSPTASRLQSNASPARSPLLNRLIIQTTECISRSPSGASPHADDTLPDLSSPPGTKKDVHKQPDTQIVAEKKRKRSGESDEGAAKDVKRRKLKLKKSKKSKLDFKNINLDELLQKVHKTS